MLGNISASLFGRTDVKGSVILEEVRRLKALDDEPRWTNRVGLDKDAVMERINGKISCLTVSAPIIDAIEILVDAINENPQVGEQGEPTS